MEALVRSFVKNVHKRVTTMDSVDALLHLPEYDVVIRNLLPMLHTGTAPDVVEKILVCLVESIHHMPACFDECGGLRKMLRFMAVYPKETLGEVARLHACRIVGSVPSLSLAEAAAHDCSIISNLVQWHLSLKEAAFYNLFTLVEALCFHPQTRREIVTAVSPYAQLLESSIHHVAVSKLDCATVLRVLVKLLRIHNTEHGMDESVLDTFCASPLEAVIRATVQHKLDTDSYLLDLLYFLSEHKKLDSVLCNLKGISSGIFEIIGMNMIRCAEDYNAVCLMCDERFLSHATRHSTFVATFLFSLLKHYNDLKSRRRNALQVCYCMAMENAWFPLRHLIELYQLPEDEYLIDRVSVASIGMSTWRIVPHFDKILNIVKHCPTDGSVSLVDETLHRHFQSMVKTPFHILGELNVHGQGSTNLLFHTILSVITTVPLCTPKLSVAVKDFLCDSIQKLPRDVSFSTTRYCAELINQFNLDLPLPATTVNASCLTCPITLDSMHLPVVASDGVSYELSAIVKVFRTIPQSPMTREMLKHWVVVNRGLMEQECRESVAQSSSESPRAAGTHRRRSRRKAANA